MRHRYKGKSSLWVRVDDQNQPLVKHGLATASYSRGDPKTYTVKPSDLEPAEKEQLLTEADWEECGKAALADREKKSGDAQKTRRVAIKIFTDGACTGNPGPAASAALLMYRGREKELARYLGEGTNNIAELDAISLGLEAVRTRHLPVNVYSDSTYAIGVLQKGWRAKKNREQIAELRRLMATFDDLRLIKVKGHSGIPENERVDELAKAEIERYREDEP